MPQWLSSNGAVCKCWNSSNDGHASWGGEYAVAVVSIVNIKFIAVFTDSGIRAVYKQLKFFSVVSSPLWTTAFLPWQCDGTVHFHRQNSPFFCAGNR